MSRRRKPCPRSIERSPRRSPDRDSCDLPLARLKLSKRISLLLKDAFMSVSLLRRGKYGVMTPAEPTDRLPSKSQSRRYLVTESPRFRLMSRFRKSSSLSHSGSGRDPRVLRKRANSESGGTSGYLRIRESAKARLRRRRSIEFMAATASRSRFLTKMRLTGPRMNTPLLELSSVSTGTSGAPDFGDILKMLPELDTATKVVSAPTSERKPMSSRPPKG